MTKANPTNNTAKKEKDPTKKKAKPKVVMSTNFSPVKVAASKKKRSTWGNHVDIYETLVLPIVIAVFIRMDNSDGSYITPFVKALKNDDTCNTGNFFNFDQNLVNSNSRQFTTNSRQFTTPRDNSRHASRQCSRHSHDNSCDNSRQLTTCLSQN